MQTQPDMFGAQETQVRARRTGPSPLDMFGGETIGEPGPLRAEADQVRPEKVLEEFEPTGAERQCVIEECEKRGIVWP